MYKAKNRGDMMKIFEAKGNFNHGGESHSFSKRIKAEDKKTATEKVYCLIGGKQRIARRFIEITGVVEEKA
jgi:large subunit ribosomal protein LX